jgi:hypothetical protein
LRSERGRQDLTTTSSSLASRQSPTGFPRPARSASGPATGAPRIGTGQSFGNRRSGRGVDSKPTGQWQDRAALPARRCPPAGSRGPRQERRNRVPTWSVGHMAPPVDHLPVRAGAQLVVPMPDDAVLQPGLSRSQAEEDIVVHTEPRRRSRGDRPWQRSCGPPAVRHRSAGSGGKLVESGAQESVAAFGDGRGVQWAAVVGEARPGLHYGGGVERGDGIPVGHRGGRPTGL